MIQAVSSGRFLVTKIVNTSLKGLKIMKQPTRFLCTLLTLCLALVSLPMTALAANSSMPFTDVKKTDWYYDTVQYAYDNNLMNGTSATAFSPEGATTRGMIVTILYRLEGEPAAKATVTFRDVGRNAWYYDAVNWAAANGIVSGYGGNLFGPDDPITREQLATILYRYSQYRGYDTSASGRTSSFSDSARISSYAFVSMNWAVSKGLLSGVSTSTLAPSGNADRAQVATILMRFQEEIVGSSENGIEENLYDILIANAWDTSWQEQYTSLFFPNGKGIYFYSYPGNLDLQFAREFSYIIRGNSVELTFTDEWSGETYTWVYVWNKAEQQFIHTFEEYEDISVNKISAVPVQKFFQFMASTDTMGTSIISDSYWSDLAELILRYQKETLSPEKYAAIQKEQTAWEAQLNQDMISNKIDVSTANGASWRQDRFKLRVYTLLQMSSDVSETPSYQSPISSEDALRIVEEKTGYYDGKIENDTYAIAVWPTGQEYFNGRPAYGFQIRRVNRLTGSEGLTQLIETVYVDIETGTAYWEAYNTWGTFD